MRNRIKKLATRMKKLADDEGDWFNGTTNYDLAAEKEELSRKISGLKNELEETEEQYESVVEELKRK